MSFDLALSSDMSRSKLMNIKGIKARLLCTVIKKKNANCGLFILTVIILIVGNFQALSDFAQSFLFQFPTAAERYCARPRVAGGYYDRMGLQHTQAWDNPILYIYIVIGKGGPPDSLLVLTLFVIINMTTLVLQTHWFNNPIRLTSRMEKICVSSKTFTESLENKTSFHFCECAFGVIEVGWAIAYLLLSFFVLFCFVTEVTSQRCRGLRTRKLGQSPIGISQLCSIAQLLI